MPMPSAWGGVQPDPQQDPDLVAYLKQTRPELFANTGGVPQPVMNAGAQLKASSDANAAAQAAAMPPPDAGQNVPRGTAPGSTQALLDQINGQQLESLKQQGLSVDALKKQLGALQGKDLPLNLQPLAALTDAWTGSHMAPNAAPEETAATRQAAVQKMQEAILKAQQGMSQDDIAMLKDKLQAQYHAEDITQRGKDRELQRQFIQAQKDSAAATKKEAKDDGDILKMSQDLDPSKASSRSGLGVAMQKVANAQALRALVDGTGENLTNTQMEELGIGLNKLISGSNAGAVSQVKALVPESAIGNSQALKQWLQNEPQGTNQQAFVRMMLGTVDREAALATKQIETYQKGKLAGYSHLKDHPRYGDVLKSYENAYGVSLRSKPDVGEIVDGHRFTGGDPGQQSSWEPVK